MGRFKVYIIDEVHMLSKSAFNAMLKTLEEPPAHVKFILATTDPQKVPVTVLSRCLQFNLRQMASTTIAEYLENVLTQENITFEPAAINLIARAAAGSMRDALSLTDQAIAYGNQTVNEAEVRSMLGAIDQNYLYEIIQSLIQDNGVALIEKAQSMQMRNIAFEAALNDLANILHQIAMAQTVPDSLANDLPERTMLLDLAQKLSPETLQLYYQIALLGRRDIGLAPDEYAGFTMTLLRMLAFAPTEKVSEKNTEKSVPNTQSVVQKIEIATVASTLTQPVEPVVLEQTESEPLDSIKNDALEAPPMLASSLVISDTFFDGNWRKLVEQSLKLGLARALAQNCEMIAYDETSITLRVAESQKHLISASYQEKLSSAINDYFGRKIRLNFEVNAETNAEINTPAKQNANEKATVQGNAEAAIMNDGFVQALMNDFGATIIPNSIKPV